MRTFILFILSAVSTLHAERHGLVIGNRDYTDTGRFGDLATTLNDATLMHQLMKQAGFQMAPIVKDATRLGIEDAVIKFCAGLQAGDEAVIYYAGHGIQYEHKVYLMGTNAEFRIKAKLGEEAVSQDTLAAMLGERGVKLAVLILDCCREVPDQSWLASDNQSRGLRGDEPPALVPPPNILVGYATSSGRLTNDSLRDNDANGPLVQALQKHWSDGLEFDQLWKAVARDVFTASRSVEQGRAELQMPSKYGQTIHDFYFVAAKANSHPVTTPSVAPKPQPIPPSNVVAPTKTDSQQNKENANKWNRLPLSGKWKGQVNGLPLEFVWTSVNTGRLSFIQNNTKTTLASAVYLGENQIIFDCHRVLDGAIQGVGPARYLGVLKNDRSIEGTWYRTDQDTKSQHDRFSFSIFE